MKKLKKIGLLFVVILMGQLLTTNTVFAATQPTVQTNINASSAIAVDADTGQVLYQQNSQKSLPIASMTKLLTAYIVLSQIKAGKLSWTQTTKPSQAAYKISQIPALTNVPIQLEQSYTIKSLFDAMLITSANDAAMMIGDAIAGSQEQFVNLMRQQAKDWQLQSAELYSTSGLDNGLLKMGGEVYPGSPEDAENHLSAADMAKVAYHLLKDYPEVLTVTSQTQANFNQQPLIIYNHMLAGQRVAYQKDGYWVDGLKTGTTDGAGECFTGTATNGKHRIITVVQNAQGSGENRRFVETAKLLDAVLSQMEPVTVKMAKKDTQVTVPDGEKTAIKANTSGKTALWLPKNHTNDQLSFNHKKQKTTIDAPVKKEQSLGFVTVDDVAYLTKPYHYQVKTQEGTQKASWWVRCQREVKGWFNSVF